MKCVKRVESVWQVVDTLSLCEMCVDVCEFEVEDDAEKSKHQETRITSLQMHGSGQVAVSMHIFPDSYHTVCSD